MKEQRFSIGPAEYVTLGGIVLVAGLVGLAMSSGFIVAFIPGVIYVGAMAAIYFGYRHRLAVPAQRVGFEAQAVADLAVSAELSEVATAPDGETQRQPVPAVFRVVGTRGICPMGYGRGTMFTVDANGDVSPRMCAAAEAVLRQAAQEKNGARERCCPIYDHLLVFRREPQAVG